MAPIAGAAGLALLLLVLWDTFETILLPRRASGPVRLARFVLDGLWAAWAAASRTIRKPSARENVLSFYAIIALLLLFVVWAGMMIVAFALLHVALGSRVLTHGAVSFWTDLYLSGTSFFTLGLGDVVPVSGAARVLTVIEAGMGFGFLALVLAYLPVLYQAFSRREARITMLDEWSGSPPSAAVLLRRGAESGEAGAVAALLHDWEVTAAELLESHLSYPVLALFRSQHDNQSWLASLTTVLDACALIITGVEGLPAFQARLTFAIARHAVVDLSQVLGLRPEPPNPDRLAPAELERLRAWLAEGGVRLDAGEKAVARLDELRAMYEPYVNVLARHLLMPLPGWLPPDRARFNWRTTAWARTSRQDAH